MLCAAEQAKAADKAQIATQGDAPPAVDLPAFSLPAAAVQPVRRHSASRLSPRIASRLSHLGLSNLGVPGNGNCFFSSLAFFLKRDQLLSRHPGSMPSRALLNHYGQHTMQSTCLQTGQLMRSETAIAWPQHGRSLQF